MNRLKYKIYIDNNQILKSDEINKNNSFKILFLFFLYKIRTYLYNYEDIKDKIEMIEEYLDDNLPFNVLENFENLLNNKIYNFLFSKYGKKLNFLNF